MFIMSYSHSSNMGSYIYTRNYGKPCATDAQKEANLNYLKNALPYSEHKNINDYIDPKGNISRDCLGNLKPDINKIFDRY